MKHTNRKKNNFQHRMNKRLVSLQSNADWTMRMIHKLSFSVIKSEPSSSFSDFMFSKAHLNKKKKTKQTQKITFDKWLLLFVYLLLILSFPLANAYNSISMHFISFAQQHSRLSNCTTQKTWLFIVLREKAKQRNLWISTICWRIS